jgi:hypothetical protein
MVVHPKQERLIVVFENLFDLRLEDLPNHHETGHSFQQMFRDELTSLVNTIHQMGNLFVEERW